jgi:hypothetical protein
MPTLKRTQVSALAMGATASTVAPERMYTLRLSTIGYSAFLGDVPLPMVQG